LEPIRPNVADVRRRDRSRVRGRLGRSDGMLKPVADSCSRTNLDTGAHMDGDRGTDMDSRSNLDS